MNFSQKTYTFLFLILIAFVSISIFSYPIIGSDSGYYLANARDFYKGNIYFIDIATAYNPLSIITIGIPFIFTESPDPRMSLAINYLLILGSSLVLYNIIKSNSKNNTYTSLLVLNFFLGSLILDGNHIMLEPLSVFFLLCGLYFYCSSLFVLKNSRLFFAGLFISLSFLSKQYGLFLLFPLGIHVILHKKEIVKKGILLALGFSIPILMFTFYLIQNGISLIQALNFIFGNGLKIDVGNGTGRTFTLFTYSLGYIFFFLCNAYLIVVLLAVKKAWRDIAKEKSIFVITFPFSFLVLVSASYVHYFQYILPFSILLFVAVLPYFKDNLKKWIMPSFLFSLAFIAVVSIVSFSTKKVKFDKQQIEKQALLSAVPAQSKVFLDGISPAYYFLCDYNSIKLNKIGYTFPGYFYTNTLTDNLELGAYIIITPEMVPMYENINNGDFSQKEIQIEGKKYTFVKRIK
jgi:hypothetical protein